MSFDAWGMRRVAQNWSVMPTLAEIMGMNAVTTQGYTGHQQVDSAGIIHMGGRIYDPRLGRFLQADPIVQEPFNPQKPGSLHLCAQQTH